MLRNRKSSFLVFGLGLSMGLHSASAQAPAAKVGIVSIQEAILATNDGKKELETLQQRYGGKQNELKAQDDELQKLKTQLQTQGDKLSPEERNARIRVIADKQKVLQRNYDDYQTEAQQAEQEILGRLGKKMIGVMDKYAKANGYTVILDVSNPQTPVVWASPGVNLTKELVDAYNSEAPAASAPKPAAGVTTSKKP